MKIKVLDDESVKISNELDASERVLLYGPSGNGKTILAKMIAKRSNCKFFNLSTSALTGPHVNLIQLLTIETFGEDLK